MLRLSGLKTNGRFLNAEAEYFEAGGVDAVTRALQIDEGEV